MGFHGSHVTHQSGEDVLFLQRAKIPCNVAFFEVQSGPRFQQFLTSSPSHRPQILLENSVTGPNSSVETLHIFTPSTLFCGGFIIHAVPKVYRRGCWPRFFFRCQEDRDFGKAWSQPQLLATKNTLWKITMLLMGKSAISISTGPCSIVNCNKLPQ